MQYSVMLRLKRKIEEIGVHLSAFYPHNAPQCTNATYIYVSVILLHLTAHMPVSLCSLHTLSYPPSCLPSCHLHLTGSLEGFMLDDKSVFGLLKKETLALKKEFAIPR